MSEPPPPNPNPNPYPSKRKRNLPGTPGKLLRPKTLTLIFPQKSLNIFVSISLADPDAQVIALSPSTLLSATTFVCDICSKEFRRDQNLQIHRRGHNLSWKFPPRSAKEEEETKKRVYVCPAEGCVFHDSSRALGDLTGIKKHYCRKHGEKRWECDTCHKKYAVRTDWKAHVRACRSKEYECACGTLFSRKESYVIHRASCGCMKGEERTAMAIVEFGFRANTVNTELLFPSLWGKVSAREDDDEQRGEGGSSGTH